LLKIVSVEVRVWVRNGRQMPAMVIFEEGAGVLGWAKILYPLQKISVCGLGSYRSSSVQ